MADNSIQHGIDDDPNNDPEKAKNIGGVGGAVTGLVAGAAAGPLGAVAGAVIGGVVGAVASKAAVKEIDKHDNDDTYTGIGSGTTHDNENPLHDTGRAVGETLGVAKPNPNDGGYTTTTTGTYDTTPGTPGNGVPGVQTGGHATDGTADTRGMTEKLADKLTGDHTDDKTGKTV